MNEPSATSAAVISADAPSRKEKKRRSRPRREALPAGWTEMRHNNSLPFYYHTESGTVCWTRPYVRKFKVEASKCIRCASRIQLGILMN